MSSPQLIINGTIRVLDADIPRFIRAVNACVLETVKEAGCLYYRVGQDCAEPDLFHMSEGWADQAAFDAHMASGHLAIAMREIAAITVRASQIKLYAVSGETQLSLPVDLAGPPAPTPPAWLAGDGVWPLGS
jgi:quinol monooxygenase YgiN